MKKTLATLMLLAVTLTAAAQTEMVRLTRFEGKKITGVSASSGFDVEVIRSDKTYAIIEVTASIEDRVIFDIDPDGTVILGIKSGKTGRLFKDIDLNAKIYLNDLRTVKATSGSEIDFVGTFESNVTNIDVNSGANIDGLVLNAKERVYITCSSAGNVKAKINTRELRCEASSASEAEIVHNGESSILHGSSASKIVITGSVTNSNIDASSTSNINANYYDIKNATLRASSASKISVGNVSELTADGSSASSIRYKGTPKIISTKASSASSIKQAD